MRKIFSGYFIESSIFFEITVKSFGLILILYEKDDTLCMNIQQVKMDDCFWWIVCKIAWGEIFNHSEYIQEKYAAEVILLK